MGSSLKIVLGETLTGWWMILLGFLFNRSNYVSNKHLLLSPLAAHQISRLP